MINPESSVQSGSGSEESCSLTMYLRMDVYFSADLYLFLDGLAHDAPTLKLCCTRHLNSYREIIGSLYFFSMLKHVSHFSSNLNVLVVLLTALTVGEIKIFLYAVSLFL